jgi:hypothetical protein
MCAGAQAAPATSFMPFELLQITAQYSNAVLVAVMPYVSDCVKNLELPIPQPVSISQVAEFKCSPRSDLFGGLVILTNGYQFAFLHGHVELYRNQKSYYFLQDPDLIPRFVGPVNLSEREALEVAHRAIKRLGYTDAMLSADRPADVSSPPRSKTGLVPRYRIRWYDSTRGHDPAHHPLSIEFEVDATSGQIQMLKIANPNTYRPDPKVDVAPRIIGHGPEMAYRNGRKIVPVSQTYSNAFLTAILPQCSEFARIVGFDVKQPLTTNDVDVSTFICGLVDGDPMAAFSLKNEARFTYRHGQVIAFYAPDVMELPDRQNSHDPKEFERFQANFYGKVNMTTNESVALVRETVSKLGYTKKMLHIDKPPGVYGPNWWGTNRIARSFIIWKEPSDGPFCVTSEVDVANKKIKSLYINDHALTNIWRKPPEIRVR